MTRLRGGLLVLAAVLSAACAAGPASTGIATTAAQRYLSPVGSDAGSCMQSAPCKTFARVYTVATAGDVVEVAGGKYPGTQTIPYDPTKGGAPVTFRPAPNATVDLGWDPAARSGGLNVLGDHVTFAGTETRADALAGLRVGFTFGFVYVGVDSNASPPHRPTGVTLRNVNVNTLIGFGTSYLTVQGGQIGPFKSCLYAPGGGAPDQCQASGALMNEDGGVFGTSVVNGVPYGVDHVLLAGIYIHDVTKPAPGTDDGNANPASVQAHTDCLQFGSGNYVTLRDDVFVNCSDTDFFTGYQSGDGFSNWVVEGNFFGRIVPPSGVAYYDFQISDSAADGRTCPNVVLRFNVVQGAGYRIACSPPPIAPGPALVYGNILPTADSSTCSTLISSANIYYEPTSGRCDTSDIVRSLSASGVPGLTVKAVLSAARAAGLVCDPANQADSLAFWSCRRGGALLRVVAASAAQVAFVELGTVGAPAAATKLLQAFAGLAYTGAKPKQAQAQVAKWVTRGAQDQRQVRLGGGVFHLYGDDGWQSLQLTSR
jgi:hypothetical protein